MIVPIFRMNMLHLKSFSLNSITCSGSMGIISARYLEHPFETAQN